MGRYEDTARRCRALYSWRISSRRSGVTWSTHGPTSCRRPRKVSMNRSNASLNEATSLCRRSRGVSRGLGTLYIVGRAPNTVGICAANENPSAHGATLPPVTDEDEDDSFDTESEMRRKSE